MFTMRGARCECEAELSVELLAVVVFVFVVQRASPGPMVVFTVLARECGVEGRCPDMIVVFACFRCCCCLYF